VTLNHFHFPVSFGTIKVSWNSKDLLTRIQWADCRLAIWQRVKVPNPLLDVVDRIRLYFYQGEPIGPVPWDLLDTSDLTPFQKEVYQVISGIPHGETQTYGWVASRIGNVAASRAVGQALKKNPYPILIPCHRIFASHSIGGFMGANDPSQLEVQLKRRLIQLEEEYKSPVFPFITPAAAWVGISRASNS